MMSEAPAPDPYATAKANLRDTIKWLATSLAAVGAAVIAGASINGLAALKGEALYWAVGLGAVGLLGILVAIGVMLSLLTSNVFYFSDLTTAGNAVAAAIDQHAQDILSPQTPTIAALVQYRQDAIRDMQAAAPGDPLYAAAFKKWTAADDLIARVTNLGQFLFLRQKFEERQPLLFFLTIVIIGALGGYALLAGSKSSLEADFAPKAVFRPGNNWADAAASLSNACGGNPLSGVMLPKKSFEGWVTVRLAEPGKCSGLELTVPASLVQLVGS
ncbi:hypothetical protein [Mesorhizobium sp. CO1-1-8]|uniref:hypothetical protein n=1 Tax=Mesorhizobium sp. CO1-1-8 TaxID=2876631 RepID=UPI001CD18858|nr:hypothetical protein [Mesorhizobium sp. CO1-1-8]MBZ9772319.1 hypothetical protein [Mesorhizobium sp. CO1-1-8]